MSRGPLVALLCLGMCQACTLIIQPGSDERADGAVGSEGDSGVRRDAGILSSDASASVTLTVYVFATQGLSGQVVLTSEEDPPFCNDEISPCDFVLVRNDPVSLFASPEESFSYWSVDPACPANAPSDTVRLVTMLQDCSVTAQFGIPDM